MKVIATAASLISMVLIMTGYGYEAPLTEEHSISVDQSVLGLWEPIPDEGEQLDPNDRMIILKYSATEYLIHHPTGKDGMYFRGYPIKIGGVSCVQIQVIGTAKGNLDRHEKELFHVVSFRLLDRKLEIKMLNTELVDDDLKDSDKLKKAFLKHKDNKDLFEGLGKLRRIEKKS